MPRIVHLDDMPTDEFIRFIEAYICQPREFTTTEKIDGQNLSFGIDNDGRFFTKTKKGLPVFDANDYPKHPLYEAIALLHTKLQTQLEHVDAGPFQVFSEYLPYPHTNLVKYDTVPDTLFFISIFTPDGRHVRQYMWPDILTNKIGMEGIPILPTKLIDVGHRFDTLKKLRTKYPSWNVVRNRKKWAKAKRIRQAIVDDIKQRFLEAYGVLTDEGRYSSRMEGVVIKGLDFWVKVVDKFTFSSENYNKQAALRELRTLETEFKKNIGRTVFKNADCAYNYKKAIQKIGEHFVVNGQYTDIDLLLSIVHTDIACEVYLSFKTKSTDVLQTVAEYRSAIASVENTIADSASDMLSEYFDVEKKNILDSVDLFMHQNKNRNTINIDMQIDLLKLMYGAKGILEIKRVFGLNTI